MIRLLVCVMFVLGAPAIASAEPEPQQTHEVLVNRPSGFWTSNQPAVGGAYRYRLLLIGCAIALGMGWMTWRLVKRTSRPGSRNAEPRQKAADQVRSAHFVEKVVEPVQAGDRRESA